MLSTGLDDWMKLLLLKIRRGKDEFNPVVERNIARTEVFLSGENDPEIQFIRGLLYVQGDGVSQDDSKAVNWFSKAARAVNTQLIGLYWGLGELITEKQRVSGWVMR